METYLNKLDESWLNPEGIIVYGFGKTGEKLISHILDYFRLPVELIIDNNPEIIKRKTFCNIDIKALDMVEDDVLQKNKIIIATGAMAYDSITESLIKRGLEEYKDFCSVEQFIPEYGWKHEKKVILCQVGTSLTTCCTLQCKNCAMFTGRGKIQKTYTLDELKQDADVFFSVVDKVLSFQIIGGEPFVHPELGKYIQYLSEKYSEKIGHIFILTNGTILPNDELLTIMSENNVVIKVSDYSLHINYEGKLEKFIEKLNEYEIKYFIYRENKWADLGFPDNIKIWGENERNIHNHMIKCSRNCQHTNDGKYYFCASVWGGSQQGIYQEEEDDYIDLRKINTGKDDDRKEILECTLGNLRGKGYLGLCRICNGFGSDNELEVDAAIQDGK